MQNDSARYIYDMFRSGIGFALVTAGITYFISPRRERVRLAIGAILTVAGILFVYNVLYPFFWAFPWATICFCGTLFLVLGQAIFEIAFFLLGKPVHRFSNKLVRRIGIVWTVVICALPALDYMFGLNAVYTSLESVTMLSPFHRFSYIVIYFWPIIACVLASLGGYIQLPSSGDNFRQFISLFVILISISVMTVALFLGLALSIPALYMAGNMLLEVSILVFYIFETRHPDIFSLLKKELTESRARKNILPTKDEERIRGTIDKMLKDGNELYDSELDIAKLAKICEVSINQLSYYFNACLGTGFASWHNDVKIKRALILLTEQPNLGILEVAFECGFGSKTVFNNQFKLQTGMTPREYRKSAGIQPSDAEQ